MENGIGVNSETKRTRDRLGFKMGQFQFQRKQQEKEKSIGIIFWIKYLNLDSPHFFFFTLLWIINCFAT